MGRLNVKYSLCLLKMVSVAFIMMWHLLCCFRTVDLPYFTATPRPVYQRQPMQLVHMPCIAHGDPFPSIAWQKVSVCLPPTTTTTNGQTGIRGRLRTNEWMPEWLPDRWTDGRIIAMSDRSYKWWRWQCVQMKSKISSSPLQTRDDRCRRLLNGVFPRFSPILPSAGTYNYLKNPPWRPAATRVSSCISFILMSVMHAFSFIARS